MIYLKAPSEADFKQALLDANWANEDSETGEFVIDAYTKTRSLDVIGEIQVKTGNTIEAESPISGNTIEVDEFVAVEGYHSNLLLHGEEMPEALAGFEIEAPTTPVRRFA